MTVPFKDAAGMVHVETDPGVVQAVSAAEALAFADQLEVDAALFAAEAASIREAVAS